ncbi:MAG: ABC transporter permease [Candidatus Sericytochromatia bacterium]
MISFILENLLFAIKSLQQHRLRTFLTMLGVIFGVAAVIAMLSIGKGAEEEAIEQIKSFGLNNIRINSIELSKDDEDKAKRTLSKGLDYEDAIYIKKILPYVEKIAPQNLMDKKVHYLDFSPKAVIVGTTPDYPYVTGQSIEKGRFITEEDLSNYRKICILGYDLSRELFLKEEAIGKFITIGGVRFRVVGVFKDKTKTKDKVKIKNRNVNKDIYIPITTSMKKFTILPFENKKENRVDYGVVDEIALKISSSQQLEEAKNSLIKILNRRHFNINDYEVVVPTELLEQSQKTQQLFNLVMACIAGLSLLIGGIGIMNIMLASVTERTKEIGIRRAIGASGSDIILYFLLEATVISIVGGVLGVFTGIALSKIITFYAEWKTIVSIESIILSFGVSSIVGVFFGFYPAYRASKMDPIQALKYE